MAGDQRHRDRLSQERAEETPPRSRPDGDLDMGGGGPTGASDTGTPHRSNLDSRGGSPLIGALDDLPDMTGSTLRGSTVADADITPPDGDNANMGQGSDRFDASDAYTGVDSDDAVLESRPSGSPLERNPGGRRAADDITGSGDSGSAGDDLGNLPGQGISPDDFRTQGSGQ